jgi:uncharacterized NAD(P)/FAD-binding protein YdhS
LRRLQPYWDAHRHRIPDEVYAVVKQMQIEQRLDVAAAQEISVRPASEGFHVATTGMDRQRERLEVSWIVNCTGPETNLVAANVPILESAVKEGIARYDPLGIGLVIDHRHATEPTGRVFAIGPLCRGCLWETIAMPEIRVQAKLIADQCCSFNVVEASHSLRASQDADRSRS